MDYSVLRPFFEGKRCAILGFGREGRVWLDILKRLGCCAEIAVADMNKVDAEGVTLLCGEDYLDRAKEYDLLLQSPGVIIKDKLTPEEKAKILTQTELLLRLRPCRIIGVTGTKGKSTTSSLIHHFLKASGLDTMLIGNIGVPPLERLEDMQPCTVAVCELSCHQLEFVQHSPEIAVLLNIFPEHLDHYTGFEAYKAAKENIWRCQHEGDVAIINTDVLPETANGKVISASFGGQGDIMTDGEDITLTDRVIPYEKVCTRLIGKHNRYNIAVALEAAAAAGADIEKCLASLPDFNGLEHRLEMVRTLDGVEYINDSICTIPEAAIAAVEAVGGCDVLVIGGMDRGISYKKLTEYLNTGAVENVILLPDSGWRIAQSLDNTIFNVVKAIDLADAVRLAHGRAKKRVVLSPAAASYGFYKNFEERGRHFKELVNALESK
ncbi:MAG: UDP-N-acetylmuramoyl-L-alanine--D-glutamate ligase [Oscillospiraceae bacterium]|nr:UDP-N-acetylmuramoyl-L-alanine--D-glutamate ligase [Oscillospiraceae bacterium]